VLRHALVLGVAGLALLATSLGCSDVDSSSSGANAPCTRDYDCEGDLTCQQGVCAAPEGDGGSVDASAGKDAAADG
jgi:hypothetical protein